MAWREDASITKLRIGQNKRVDDAPFGVTFTVNAEAANAITVNCQVTDARNKNMAQAACLGFYLATDSAGLNPAGTAPTGGIAAGTNGALIEHTANLSGKAVTEADGKLDVVLTDTGTPTFYLVIVLPNGKLAVSSAITFV